RTLLPPSAFFLLTRPPPTSTLFPYTTLFRSVGGRSRSEQPCPGARRGRGPSPWHAGGQHRHRGEPAQVLAPARPAWSRTARVEGDRKSTRLNSSHVSISYAVFCLKKKKKKVV